MPKNETYLTVTGEIRYNMTNDYMFRAILQENEKVLRGLVSSLLHMRPEDIKTITVENPITLGDAMDRKTIVFDVKLILNTNVLINLEMQLLNEHNWPERSLFYLCRAFTKLLKGEDYSKLQPVFHIGFLDFTLFPDHPEFYAIYKLLNTKDYHLYSDKLTLGVVNLNRTDLATDEDKTFGIDNWVKIFKAKTWEELRMFSENNEYVEEMVRSLFKFNSDEQVREQCEEIEIELAARKARYRDQDEAVAKLKAELAEALAEKAAFLAQKDASLAEKDAELAEKDNELAEKDNELARLKALLKEHNIEIP